MYTGIETKCNDAFVAWLQVLGAGILLSYSFFQSIYFLLVGAFFFLKYLLKCRYFGAGPCQRTSVFVAGWVWQYQLSGMDISISCQHPSFEGDIVEMWPPQQNFPHTPYVLFPELSCDRTNSSVFSILFSVFSPHLIAAFLSPFSSPQLWFHPLTCRAHGTSCLLTCVPAGCHF